MSFSVVPGGSFTYTTSTSAVNATQIWNGWVMGRETGFANTSSFSNGRTAPDGTTALYLRGVITTTDDQLTIQSPNYANYATPYVFTILNGLNTSQSYRLRFSYARWFMNAAPGWLRVYLQFGNNASGQNSSFYAEIGEGSMSPDFQEFTTSSFTPTTSWMMVVIAASRWENHFVFVDKVMLGDGDTSNLTTIEAEDIPKGLVINDFPYATTSDSRLGANMTSNGWSYSYNAGWTASSNYNTNTFPTRYPVSINGFLYGHLSTQSVGTTNSQPEFNTSYMSATLSGLSTSSSYSLAFWVSQCVGINPPDSFTITIDHGTTSTVIYNQVPSEMFFSRKQTSSFTPTSSVARVTFRATQNGTSVQSSTRLYFEYITLEGSALSNVTVLTSQSYAQASMQGKAIWDFEHIGTPKSIGSGKGNYEGINYSNGASWYNTTMPTTSNQLTNPVPSGSRIGYLQSDATSIRSQFIQLGIGGLVAGQSYNIAFWSALRYRTPAPPAFRVMVQHGTSLPFNVHNAVPSWFIFNKTITSSFTPTTSWVVVTFLVDGDGSSASGQVLLDAIEILGGDVTNASLLHFTPQSITGDVLVPHGTFENATTSPWTFTSGAGSGRNNSANTLGSPPTGTWMGLLFTTAVAGNTQQMQQTLTGLSTTTPIRIVFWACRRDSNPAPDNLRVTVTPSGGSTLTILNSTPSTQYCWVRYETSSFTPTNSSVSLAIQITTNQSVIQALFVDYVCIAGSEATATTTTIATFDGITTGDSYRTFIANPSGVSNWIFSQITGLLKLPQAGKSTQSAPSGSHVLWLRTSTNLNTGLAYAYLSLSQMAHYSIDFWVGGLDDADLPDTFTVSVFYGTSSLFGAASATVYNTVPTTKTLTRVRTSMFGSPANDVVIVFRTGQTNTSKVATGLIIDSVAVIGDTSLTSVAIQGTTTSTGWSFPIETTGTTITGGIQTLRNGDFEEFTDAPSWTMASGTVSRNNWSFVNNQNGSVLQYPVSGRSGSYVAMIRPALNSEARMEHTLSNLVPDRVYLIRFDAATHPSHPQATFRVFVRWGAVSFMLYHGVPTSTTFVEISTSDFKCSQSTCTVVFVAYSGSGSMSAVLVDNVRVVENPTPGNVQITTTGSISTTQCRSSPSSLAMLNSDKYTVANNLSTSMFGSLWTMELFAYVASYPTQDTAFIRSVEGQMLASGLFIGIIPDGRLLIRLGSNESNAWNVGNAVTSGAVALNTWHHVALVYAISEYRWYVNGSLVTTFAQTQDTCNSFTTLYLGCNSLGGPAINGYIDDFRISETALYRGSTVSVPSTPYASNDVTSYVNSFSSVDGTTNTGIIPVSTSVFTFSSYATTSVSLLYNTQGGWTHLTNGGLIPSGHSLTGTVPINSISGFYYLGWARAFIPNQSRTVTAQVTGLSTLATYTFNVWLSRRGDVNNIGMVSAEVWTSTWSQVVLSPVTLSTTNGFVRYTSTAFAPPASTVNVSIRVRYGEVFYDRVFLNRVSEVTIPGTPTITSLVASAGSAVLTWTAPASNGGGSITSYTVTYTTASNVTVTLDNVSGTSSTVTGLINGTAYTFRVAAVNVAGQGSFSSTLTATPSSSPSAPVSLTATAGNAFVSLSWEAPLSTGGSTIESYTLRYTFGVASRTLTGLTGTSTVVSNLVNGTLHTFYLSAVNTTGSGTESSGVQATPSSSIVTTPFAPMNLKCTTYVGQLDLTWTEPSVTGGAPITSYIVKYISSPEGTRTQTGITSTQTTLTGLTNGIAYTLTVAAVNSAGTGTESAQVIGTPESLTTVLTSIASQTETLATQKASVVTSVAQTTSSLTAILDTINDSNASTLVAQYVAAESSMANLVASMSNTTSSISNTIDKLKRNYLG